MTTMRELKREMAREEAESYEEVQEAKRFLGKIAWLEEQRKNIESSLAIAHAEMKRSLLSFYTPGEAASRLSVGPKTIVNDINRGKLIGVQLGTKWYVMKESVERDVRFRD